MTKHDESRHQLISDRQSKAIDLLLLGESITQVSNALGISRQTVSVWLNQHAPFIAELNRRRHQHRMAVESRYDQAVGLALEVVVERLKSGDRDLALAIFRTVGRHLSETRSRTDPDSLVGVLLSLARRRENESLMQLGISVTNFDGVERESELAGDWLEQPPRT